MSGGSARTIRNFSLELWQDLVLHGIRKSTFQHLTANWNFNVLEMAFIRIVQGLSRAPLLFIPRYLTNIFSEHMFARKKRELTISKVDPGKLDDSFSPRDGPVFIVRFTRNDAHLLLNL